MNRKCIVLTSLLLGGCVEAELPSSDTETVELEAADYAATNTVTLAEFVGSFDSETGEIAIDFVDPVDAAAAEYRVAREALGFCNALGINGGGGLHAFRMDTVLGSISTTVADCIPPAEVSAWNSLFYAAGGGFCATVRVTNNSDFSASDVVAEITGITPGYEGYAFQVVPDGAEPCCGTGADLSGLTGQNLPTDLGGGAFSHGDLEPGAMRDTQWTFRNAGGSFRFSGRLTASFSEQENGRDDDCDGRIDNNTNTYADAAVCKESGDCVSGLCIDIDIDSGDGVCAETCAANTYGEACVACGSCGSGTCNDGAGGDGSCVCPAGFGGSICNECASGFFGASCDACADCGAGFCADGIGGSGACECPDGVHGAACEFTCSDGVLNGSEAEIDSGGPCGSPIAAGSIAAGDRFTCAIEDGEVLCFGASTSGALGRGDSLSAGNHPARMGAFLVPVDMPEPAVSVYAGLKHACAISDSGNLYCWGVNNAWQLGRSDLWEIGRDPRLMPLVPVRLGTGRTVTDVALGYFHSCALLDDGSVKCWGQDNVAQLGLGIRRGRVGHPTHMGDSLPAVDLGTGRTAVDIAAGERHTCAVLDDGSVKCWGYGGHHQLGNGERYYMAGDHPSRIGDNLAPVLLGTGVHAEQISAGRFHTCALLTGGDVKCWGVNNLGQLGQGNPVNRGRLEGDMGDNLQPIGFAPGLSAVSVEAGEFSSCATFDDGSSRCWGSNSTGVLMQGHTRPIGRAPSDMANLGPMDVGSGRSAVEISRSPFGAHACARLDDGTVRCWGHGVAGQLGTGNNQVYGYHPSRVGDAIPIANLDRTP